MLRRAVIAGVLVLAALPAPARRQAPSSFPAGVELVRLDVVVLGKDGRPVTGLQQSDFEIRADGAVRAIETFEPVAVHATAAAPAPQGPESVSTPRVPVPEDGHCYLVFFDDIHVSAPVSEWVRSHLAPFLEREVRDGDWVTVVAPEERIWWTARTPWEHRLLPALVRRLSGQLNRNPTREPYTDYDAMQAVEYGSRTGARDASRGAPMGGGSGMILGAPRAGSLSAEMVYAVAQRRIRRTLGTLCQAIDSMAGFRGHKILFLYSEGFIRAPALRSVYEPVVEEARRAGVVVQLILPQGLGSGLTDASNELGMSCGNLLCLDTEAGGSTYLAYETGGRASLSNDVTAPIAQALAESSAYYLLGFRPGEQKPGEHRVRVRVLEPGLKVRARDRYFVAGPGDDHAASAAAALHAVADATGVPLRMSAAVGEPPARGVRAVSLSLELDAPAGRPRERRLRLVVEARRMEGGAPVLDSAEITLPATTEPRVVVRELQLVPGIWQARVVVTDLGTGALGSVVHTFAVGAAEPDPPAR